MRICCLCGLPVRPGEISLELHRNRELPADEGGRPRGIRIPFENGSHERVAHDLCPVLFGAPRALTGTDGSRLDV